MSIQVNLSNLVPMQITGINCRRISRAKRTKSVITPQVFCYCKYECVYEECAFALPGGNAFQNDKSEFIFTRVEATTDTIEFELWKNGVKIEDLTDNTFGEFFDFGDFDSQPDHKAFRIHWLNVLMAHDSGQYQLRANTFIAGNVDVFVSRFFRLTKFDLKAADGTVRIETIQNGSINGGPSEFDYSGMNWDSMIRIKGKLSGRIPVKESDFYMNSQREKIQVQDKIITSYNLQTRLLPKVVQDIVIYSNMLANSIVITDYNIFSQHLESTGNNIEYKRIELFSEEIREPAYFEMNRKGNFIINFTDRIELPLKRTET